MSDTENVTIPVVFSRQEYETLLKACEQDGCTPEVFIRETIKVEAELSAIGGPREQSLYIASKYSKSDD